MMHHHLDLTNNPRITNITEDFVYKYDRTLCYSQNSNALSSTEVIDSLNRHVRNSNEFFYGEINGIVIHTTNGLPIVLSISIYRECCESYGVEADFPENFTREDFIGAVIYKIRWGREIRNRDDEIFAAEIVIETNKGNMTLTVWNRHNSYYPHSVVACFNDKVEQFEL